MENRKYQLALVQQAKLQNTFYNYTTLQPCAYFWKQLVKGKQTPSLLVPDTLLINDKQTPLIWIYTNSKGKLEKSTNINLKDFVNKITNYCSPNELTATLKRVTYNDHYINGNDAKLLNARYLQNASLQQLGGQGQSIITLQRYVKSNGNNPFICRTVWRKDKKSACYIITNKKSFYDESEPEAKRFIVKLEEPSKGGPSPSTIVKAIQGKHLKETCKSLKQIKDFMKLYRGITFSQIVGDFIKDQSGNWWLINIKAFQIQPNPIDRPLGLTTSPQHPTSPNQLQPPPPCTPKQKYQKTKICRYCQKSYLQSQLTHYMTIRMLIETDRYLLHLGKNYKWLKRSDFQNVDTHCLYQEHKICQRCYRLYMEIQELMEVQDRFLKGLGFVMDKKPKELLMSLTNQEELKNQSKNKELVNLAECFEGGDEMGDMGRSNFPKTIQLGPNSNIIFQNDIPTKNDHIINKMTRYRMILYLRQLDQIQFPQFLQTQYPLYHFYLQYQLFGVKNKIKLDFNNNFIAQKKLLTIKKLKINYFFSHSHQDVNSYLNGQDENFQINIFVELRNNGAGTKTMFKQSNMKKKSYQESFGKQHQAQDHNKSDKDRKILLGKLKLPIKQFFSNMTNPNTTKITKKDFYKFFSVDQVPHGWGLEGSIGIIPSESDVNTSRMIFFTEDNLIYLPNDNYYYCEHLPEEWIDVMKKELNAVGKGNMIEGSGYKGNGSVLQSICNQVETSGKDQFIFNKSVNSQNKTSQPFLKTAQQKISTQQKEKPNRSQAKQQRNSQNQKVQLISVFSQQTQSKYSTSQNSEWKKQLLKKQLQKYEKSTVTKAKDSLTTGKSLKLFRFT